MSYIYCVNKHCTHRGKKTHIANADDFLPPKGHIPVCPVCGQGQALHDSEFQQSFNKIFSK